MFSENKSRTFIFSDHSRIKLGWVRPAAPEPWQSTLYSHLFIYFTSFYYVDVTLLSESVVGITVHWK